MVGSDWLFLSALQLQPRGPCVFLWSHWLLWGFIVDLAGFPARRARAAAQSLHQRWSHSLDSFLHFHSPGLNGYTSLLAPHHWKKIKPPFGVELPSHYGPCSHIKPRGGFSQEKGPETLSCSGCRQGRLCAQDSARPARVPHGGGGPGVLPVCARKEAAVVGPGLQGRAVPLRRAGQPASSPTQGPSMRSGDPTPCWAFLRKPVRAAES